MPGCKETELTHSPCRLPEIACVPYVQFMQKRLYVKRVCMCVFVCVPVLLTEAAELADDVGQGDVSHTLQLILDVPWQHCVAQVPGLNGAFYQRHPSTATPLPAKRGEDVIAFNLLRQKDVRSTIRIQLAD